MDETTCEENKSFLISMLEFMRIPRFVLFLFAAGESVCACLNVCVHMYVHLLLQVSTLVFLVL